nr:hypothetical protein [Candidatus Sigynarchaeota archaeon]
MLLLIDTCFWNHCNELSGANIWDFRSILSKFRWGYTSAVLDEIKHYKLDRYVPVDQALLMPVTQAELLGLQKRDALFSSFDLADQTLIAAAVREQALILTDDTPLQLECMGLNVPALKLPVFMLRLIKDGLAEKPVFSRSLRFWEENGRYRKVDLKRWKKELQFLQ